MAIGLIDKPPYACVSTVAKGFGSMNAGTTDKLDGIDILGLQVAERMGTVGVYVINPLENFVAGEAPFRMITKFLEQSERTFAAT